MKQQRNLVYKWRIINMQMHGNLLVVSNKTNLLSLQFFNLWTIELTLSAKWKECWMFCCVLVLHFTSCINIMKHVFLLCFSCLLDLPYRATKTVCKPENLPSAKEGKRSVFIKHIQFQAMFLFGLLSNSWWSFCGKQEKGDYWHWLQRMQINKKIKAKIEL